MIPYPAAYARLAFKDGTTAEASILDLSAIGFSFRSSQVLKDIEKAETAFYFLSSEKYEKVSFSLFSTELVESTAYYEIYRLETEDPHFRTLAGSFMDEYGAYVALKSQGDDCHLTHVLKGTPEEKSFSYPLSLTQLRNRLFSVSPEEEWLKRINDFHLSLSLSTPWSCESFLNTDFETFKNRLFSECGIDSHPISKCRFTQLHIGNSFCMELCPDEKLLLRVLKKAEDESLSAAVVLAPVPERCLEEAERLLSVISHQYTGTEICANDPGTLIMATRLFNTVSAGVLLTKHRKDARVYPAGPWELSSDAADFLTAMGVTRIAFDGLQSCRKLPLKAELYFPFYQTNTADTCLMKEGCGSCSHPCRSVFSAYPQHTGAVGRYNSIFGCDEESLFSGDYLRCAQTAGADTLILEVLP